MKRKYSEGENPYTNLLSKEEQPEAKKQKREVSKLFLRDLHKMNRKQLLKLYEKRSLFEPTPGYVYFVRAEYIVKLLSETFSGKQHYESSALEKLLEDKCNTLVLQWMVNNLLYWNYMEWDETYTLSILRKYFGDSVDNFKVKIDGKFIDQIVDLIEYEDLSRSEIYEYLVKDYPILEVGTVDRLLNWIEMYIYVIYSKDTNVSDIFSKVEPSNQPLREYDCDTTIPFIEFPQTRLKFCVKEKITKNYQSREVGNFLCIEGIEGSGKSRLLNEIPRLFRSYVDEDVRESTKLIDIRVSFSEMKPTLEHMKKFKYYLMARILYAYMKHVRSFEWEGTTETMTDLEAIEYIMNDLDDIEDYYFDDLYTSIRKQESIYSDGKKIWIHVSLDDFDNCFDYEEYTDIIINNLRDVARYCELKTCVITYRKANIIHEIESRRLNCRTITLGGLLKSSELVESFNLPIDENVNKIIPLLGGNPSLLVSFSDKMAKGMPAIEAYQELCDNYSCKTTPKIAENEIKNSLWNKTMIPIPRFNCLVDIIVKAEPSHVLNMLCMLPFKWYLPVFLDRSDLKRLFQVCIYCACKFSANIDYSLLQRNFCNLKESNLENLDFKTLAKRDLYLITDTIPVFDIFIGKGIVIKWKRNQVDENETNAQAIDVEAMMKNHSKRGYVETVIISNLEQFGVFSQLF